MIPGCQSPGPVFQERPQRVTECLEEARNYVRSFCSPFALTRASWSYPLVFSHHRIALKDIMFDWVVIDCEATVSIAGPRLENHYLVQIPLQGRCLVQHQGESREVAGGSAFILNPFTPSTKTWHGQISQMMVWIDRRFMAEVLASELGYDLEAPLEFRLNQLDEERVQVMLKNMLSIVTMLQTSPAPPHWRVARQLERMLVTDILATLPHNYSAALDRSENNVAPYYVRRVERFLRKRLGEQIVMKDVCEVAGVSERALFYAFRQFRRTTPMAYLKTLRLEEARRKLLRASEAGGTVTEIAIDCGFTYLSAFSREYKRRFNESPSETLKQGMS